MLQKIVYGLSIPVGLLRPLFLFCTFNKHILLSYQALAHILIGMLIVMMIHQYKYAKEVFWTLTVIEVICAILMVIL